MPTRRLLCHNDPGHSLQIPARARPDPHIKHTASDRSMCAVERIQECLANISRVYFLVKQHTFTYSSQVSSRNSRIPSSFLPSCSSTNFMSRVRHLAVQHHMDFLLPGVTNADTVHSLNLSIPLKYLLGISTPSTPSPQHPHHVLFPHLVFHDIQTCIRDHLYHMSILSSPYPHRSSTRVLRSARRPRQRSQCSSKRTRRPRR
jgi:hypothetical protein